MAKVFGNMFYQCKCNASALNNMLKILPRQKAQDRNILEDNISIATKIIKQLENQSRYKIARTFIGGSVAKGTDISSSDIDYYLFMANDEPPYHDILLHFEDILTSLEICIDLKIRRSKFAVNLKSESFNLDIVPVANHAKDIALKIIQQNPYRNTLIYNTSFVEHSVQFIRSQSDFAKDMVRITKYWYKSLNIGYVRGGKLFIELATIYIAQQNPHADGLLNRYLIVFIEFLKMLHQFKNLNIVFKTDDAVVQSHWCRMDNSLPRVIDPVNTYRNLTKMWGPSMQRKLESYACNTHKRLENFIKRNQWPSTDQQLHDLLFKN